MRWQKTVTLVEAHAEGEIGRVVTGGIIDIPGKTTVEKMDHINTVDDSLRRFLVFEPRGTAQMSTNLLVPPSRPEADAAFIILQGDKAHAMSGSNCMCVVTVLLETGMIACREPETAVTLETPAGLVTATARCRDGHCEQVALDMPVSFADRLDVDIDVPDIGRVRMDIAFGGVFYALVDPRQIGLTIAPEQARRLVAAGSDIHRAVNRQLAIVHPEIPEINGLSYVMFVDRMEDGTPVGATIMPPGRIDRSPCGTGNAARAAVMAARGEIAPGGRFSARSIIGSRFEVEVASGGELAGRPGIRPRITGRAWIHGIHQIGHDPTDPYPHGFAVSDCWGDAFDLLN